MNKAIAMAFISCFYMLPIDAQNNSFAVQVQIEKGKIEGLYDTQTGLQTYFGVPFAKAPIGDLRWKAPQELDKWEGVKITKSFGPRPIQTIVWGDMGSRSNGLSEDCLYLNVWTPVNRTTSKLPVLVYFYGGGNFAGDASELRYDGANMAKKGIVVVTVNYRLGVFGFLAHPELSAESPYKASGNYGLLDQNAALRWVAKNIAALGGDPQKVSIAGESAGSIAVSSHMASPLSKGLFAGAIGESGAAINPTMMPISLASAEKEGLEFTNKSGNLSIKQLREMDTRAIYEFYLASNQLGFSTVIDGYFFTKSLPETFKAKQQAQVPLLLGWNSAEIPGSSFMQGKPYTDENYIELIKENYPTNFDEVLKLYPHGSIKEIELSATALSSDLFIAYSTWKWFDLHRKNSSQAVYRYLYSKLRPPLIDKSLNAGMAGGTLKKDEKVAKNPIEIGAPHACEIEYCMGNLSLNKDFAWTADDFKTSETMMNYFANFIKTGNPNGAKLPNWSAASANDPNPPVMLIDTNSKEVKATNDARYLFLDKTLNNN